MTEDGIPAALGIGVDAAWGFAATDLTSPALAAAAGSLVDGNLPHSRVTELRIHGVSGSDGPTMLEHPTALQVAGDSVTGFYRRWSPDGPGRPSVPWRLEAYSWGGLTEKPLASASWLLLAPFMMYNVAHFMLPPAKWAAVDAGTAAGTGRAPGDRGTAPAPHLTRDSGHHAAHVLLRLLALAATVQLISAVATVTVSMVAWQAAGRAGMLPGWMGWYAGWTVGWRAAGALLAVAAAVALLWLMSVRTANRYEARISTVTPELSPAWPLTQQGFWKGGVLVGRQRALHAAAACAAAALLVAYPAGRPGAARWAALIFAAMALAAAAGMLASPLADRHQVSMVRGGEPAGRTGWWSNAVLAAAAIAVAASALAVGLTDHRHGPQPGALPGLTGFLLLLLAAQLVLLIAFGCAVGMLAARAPRAPRDGFQPYLGGWLAALIAALAIALGGLLTAVVNFGVARLLGTPTPSGFGAASATAVDVPWPVFAFGAVSLGALAGGGPAAAVLYLRYRRRWRRFDKEAGGRSQVADAYPGGDDAAFDKNRRAIAKAWAVGLLADDAGVAVALITGFSLAVVLGCEVFAFLGAGTATMTPYRWSQGAATVIGFLGLLAAGAFVGLLRAAYSDSAKRKTIGALWDVATFWPRAAHPFAPPCYAERAVPEVADRITLLCGQADRADGSGHPARPAPGRPDRALLLTGYSQGSIIAPAVVAQLPPRVREHIGLLTLACPARRLYGRAFPAYFGAAQLETLLGQLGGGGPGGRWKNLVRRSDYIGSWIFAEPGPASDADRLPGTVDQLCLDPVALVPDGTQAVPATHRHSRWWQDPRTGAIGSYLVGLLDGMARISARPADRF